MPPDGPAEARKRTPEAPHYKDAIGTPKAGRTVLMALRCAEISMRGDSGVCFNLRP